MTELEINIAIVLAIYLLLNLLILYVVHLLTRKYNDKK